MGKKAGRFLKKSRNLAVFALILFALGALMLWMATLRIPALEDLSERKPVESVKI